MSKWTAEEEGYLRGAWGHQEVDEISRHLQRSTDAIRFHARNLGLPSQTKARWQIEHDAEPPTPEGLAEKVFEAAKEAWRRVEPIITKPPPERKRKWGLHEAGLMLSDAHIGLEVDPSTTGGFGGYNLEIAAKRCRTLRDNLLEITAIHQEAMILKRLNIFALGDELEGHGQIYPSQAFYLDIPLYRQWLVFGEMMVHFLQDLLQAYEEIKVYKVWDNHARIGRKGEHHPQDNVSLMLWNYIAARLANEKRIKFAISPSWFMLVRRMGWTFYLSHGEDTLPWSPYAARGAFNVKLRLNSLFGEKINYLLLAHHHVSLEIERELEGSIIYNGSWIGPTEYCLKGLHEANMPSQNFFLIHPRFGVTAFDKIRLADLKAVRNVSVDEE